MMGSWGVSAKRARENVVVYEGDDGKAVVLAMDPTKTMAEAGNPKLVELAATVKEKLTRALAHLE